MAATRKLQGEIDRCLKKVTEGVETFEDIWQKVHNATNSNQKEKYEADLKKEIKKLQRLRDQIKSWIASGEIKDKSALLENRRLIETQMERFKIVERETKTKAYSKEGLGAAQKLDPAQRVKDEIRNWLKDSISSLQLQIDQYESEIESLLAGKKKRLDRDKQDRMDELRAKLDRHKFHITKLETLLRLLDNDGVEVKQVARIKEDVEYYIESSQEPDFEENEYMYDEIIGLDEVELSGTGNGIPSSATTDSNNSNETGGSPSSCVSGGSPVQSPAALNCSNANNLNYSSDSTSVEFTSADKRNKNENNASSKTKQPVKPTAVRANNKADANSNSSSSNNSNSVNNSQHTSQPQSLSVAATVAIAAASTQQAQQLQQQQQQQQQQQNKSIISSTPSKNQSHGTNNLTTGNSTSATSGVAALNNNNQQQQQQQQQQQNSTGVGNHTSSTSSNIQAQSVIQPTQPIIAFAAVAKNNAYSSSTHNNTSNSNSIGNNATTITTPTTNSNSSNVVGNSTLVNCISPNPLTNSNNAARGSPGLVSPKQQQQLANGTLLNHNSKQPGIIPVSGAPTLNSNNLDAMSTLKTIAQEAINRASTDSNLQAAPTPADTRQQQNQQTGPSSQQQQQSSTQHFSSVVTDGTANQNVNGPSQPPQQVGTTASVVSGNSNVSTVGATTNAGSLNVGGSTSQGNVTANVGGNKQISVGTNEAYIPPLLGVAPLGTSPLNKEHQMQFQMMETAYYHLPTPSDSEKLTTYLPRQPVQTPPHYPQTQLPHSDTVEFFQRLSTETLFFIFYYMEGSKAQYLAAKALKKQSWRFHTKYMMWFQRHEEPKVINDDFEQGTYIYFDYEKWGQRKKEGFTFEYKFLEDKDLN